MRYLIFTLVSLSSNLTYSQEFEGYIKAQLRLTNSQELNVRYKFTMEQSETIQMTFVSTTKITRKNRNKYLLKFKLDNVSGDDFECTIEVYQEYYAKVSKRRDYKKILNMNANGKLNAPNKFSITSKTGPNLSTHLNLDKKFTLDEIKERLKMKHLEDSKL